MPSGIYKRIVGVNCGFLTQGFQRGHPNLGKDGKNPFAGRKHTKEARKKMSEERKGKKCPWTSERMRGLTGEKAPNWRGGNCIKKNERNDSLYQYWVGQVKKRDKGICKINNQDCSGYCIVHHILPWRDYQELRYEINNGITLCQFHHPRKRMEEQKLIPFFQNLVEVKEL